MSNYQILIDLENAGFLNDLVKRGILPYSQSVWLKIYKEVQKQLKEDGAQKMVVYQNVAEIFGVSITTVRDAVRWCEL